LLVVTLLAVARLLSVARSLVVFARRLVVVLRLVVARQASSPGAKPAIAASPGAVAPGWLAWLIALLVRAAGFVGLLR
jgi:hypothetical protein